jgi:serine protease AprX
MSSTPHPSGRIRWALMCLALVAFAAFPVASAGAAGSKARVIVQVEPGGSVASAKAQVRADGGEVTADLPIVNGFAATLPASAADDLADAAGIHAVTRDGAVEPQKVKADKLKTAYPASVNAPEAWNRRGIEATGKGVGVAVIDTGIAGDLPDFEQVGPSKESRVVASVVVNPDARSARDGYGHGTHVAGIIAGNSNERPYGDPLQGRYIGIAPEANLISVKVADDDGNATVLDVIRGLQFVVDHKADYNIRVVNLSLESSVPGSYKTDPLDAAVEAAWFKGIVVVAAAGNRGSQPGAVSYAPGNDPYVITVGAIDDDGSKADGDDARPSWSSRGKTADGFVKPEIHAPGAGIVSTLAPDSDFSRLCPSCIVDGQMIRAGGTSMAAPVVSGAIALILQKRPWLTPNQIKGTLVRNSRMINGKFPGLDLVSAGYAVLTNRLTTANQGLTPNEMIDPATGEIDYSRSSWSRSSWSMADGALSAGWARSSWSCVCPDEAPAADGEDVSTSRSSWSRSSWSRSSWSTSWTK